MKNILVAIDFSDASFNAISYAAFLANAFAVPITLVHAYSNQSAFDGGSEHEISSLTKSTDAENDQFLKNEMEGILKKFTVKIDSIVKKGDPIKVITEIAEKKHSDIIVMGMKGKGQSNSRFGSTTTAMINKTTSPLLIIPKNASYQTVDTITLASDFNHDELLINFPVLEKLIHRFNPFIQVLKVQKKNSALKTELISDKMDTRLMWDKYNHSIDIIEWDNVEEGINRYVKSHPTNLLIMVARKRNFISQTIQPSHTKKMASLVKIPLLVLQEDDAEK